MQVAEFQKEKNISQFYRIIIEERVCKKISTLYFMVEPHYFIL